MQPTRSNVSIATATALAITLLACAPHEVRSQFLVKGTMEYSHLVGGPADLVVRELIIPPNTELGWHHHPGIGAYTVVKEGTLYLQDGCGSERMYQAGDAFLEPPNRVHRGKNPDQVGRVVTIQTLIVPKDSGISAPHPSQACGAPLSAQECKGGGWAHFTHPRTFVNQGDCEGYVKTGR